ncbi:MAG: glycosyltransferase [Candidatus Omnitrophota bacterium]
MKIAIILGDFPKLSETFILNQITALIDLGHDVDIFAFNKTKENKVHSDVIKYNLLDKCVYFDIPETRLKRIIKTFKIIFCYSFFYPRELFNCLNFKKFGGKYYALNKLFLIVNFLKKKYDIIHCHFGPIGNETIFLKDIFPKVKFIVSFHGYDIRLGLNLGGEIYKNLFEKANFIIAISSYTKEKLINLGCSSKKIIVSYNSVDLDRFISNGTKVDKEHGDYFVITNVARLVDEKNIPFALKVLKAIKDEKKYNFKYYLVGNGKMKEDIEKQILEMGLKDIVILLGDLPREEVIRRLEETDIFFLSSKAEGLPNVLLEAQAMQIPVVATNVGGVSEAMIDGITGYLIPDGDILKAKDKLINLMTKRELISKFGKSGRMFVEKNFNINHSVKRLTDVYSAV